MLINDVSVLVFLLITSSWASSSDDGEEPAIGFSRIAKNPFEEVPDTPDISSKSSYLNALINYYVRVFSNRHSAEETTASFSLIAENLIKEALDTPDISSKLSSSSHAILSSFTSKNEYAMPFYDFAIKNYNFNGLGFDSQEPKYWNAFINCPFRKFSRNQPDQAQVIINKLVLPSHSFLSQVLFTFQTADFLDQFIPDIDIYLDKVAYNIFIQEFSQILALEDLSEAEILCKALLRKAKNISFDDPEFKYHHAFIVNVPFHYFKKTIYCHPEHYNDICSYISKLAPILYYEIAENSKQLADKILAEILPSQTDMDITEIAYEKIISEFQGSLLQPIDNSYLWDPQQFHTDLLEAVQTFIAYENLHLPYYTMIIEFVSKDSDLAHLFRHYIAQNCCKPSNISAEHQPLFWRSLILSSFSVFSSLFSLYSSQILQHSQLSPSLNQFQSLFINEILDDQFSPKYYFRLVAEWGHTFTVDLLLQRRTDISADDVGSALESAAEGGHMSTVDLLLQLRTDISADDVGSALESAAKSGHISTVDLLLQRRTDIFADDVGSALESAAKSGHISTVDLFFQRRTDIAAYHVGWALRYAAECGHISTVDLLLQLRTDISADDVGGALRYAAKGGRISTVDLLLQRRTDISADDVGSALESAAEDRHISTVDLILQRRADISADDVGSALRNTAKVGQRRIMDIFLQRRTDIAAHDIGSALCYAAKGGYLLTIDVLLQRRTDITAAYVGRALGCAAKAGQTSAINIFLQRRFVITSEDIGRALRNAAEGGHISTFDLLLQRCIDIPAEDVVWALHNGAKVGHRRIIDLLLKRRPDIATAEVGSALKIAAKAGHRRTVYLLLNRRPDIHANDFGGALRHAAKNGHCRTVDLLFKRRIGISSADVRVLLKKQPKADTPLIMSLFNTSQISLLLISIVLLASLPKDVVASPIAGQIPLLIILAVLSAMHTQGFTHVIDLIFQLRTKISGKNVGQRR
jgi:ankyrin repeat protein